MKIIAYIAAAILIFFGVLFIWGAFDPNTPDSDELRLEVLKLAKRWKPKKKAIN